MVVAAPSPSTTLPSASGVTLAEIVGALSFALDMTEGQPPGHCVRCCHIGIRIAEELGLPAAARRDLYYTLLMKDLGCSSNAARICELYLADDISFKSEFKEIDDSLASVLRFILQQTGLKAGLSERFRALVNIARNGGAIAQEMIETRCQRGAAIARRMRFSEDVARAIHSLDEHWNGNGRPERLAGEAIPLYARIALVAQVADVFHRSGGRDAAREEVRLRRSSWFDPAVVAAFEQAADRDGFWSGLEDEAIATGILAQEPGSRLEPVDEDYLDDIAAAFAEVIDSKSPYTAGHSDRVALFTDMIGESLGFDPARRRRLKRAALLHDIGKLGVSNQILDKPGKLDEAEWLVVRSHPTLSEEILSRISAFAELATIGGAHHERLDGKGYPRGLAGSAIPLDVRVVTVADIFDALTANRPYRKAMTLSQALAILDADTGTAVDGTCVAALRQALARIDAEAVTAAG
ncbi:HD-GYP domain-containing protein [Aurantimonas sp. HBX-1]|uniref:HD-GYP domain-containing protein n=1 Tax=Aurantimonas sp. HBX-1 TaxID=2906072 RepID=UPI001F2ED647|nr:HD domain-containing protein [Aurantimonas sp. HBX-1]UIJ71804.1 HD domain-containing protein [Aurantimonas sp. HBX-1]